MCQREGRDWRRGRSPRRARPSTVAPRGDLFLKIGEVRSDTGIDASLRALTRAHRDNERIVIRLMRSVNDHGVEVSLPTEISQRACDAAWRLLQMSEDSDGRAAARAMLQQMSTFTIEDVLNVALVLLQFTHAQDIITKSVMAQAMLMVPGDDHGDDVPRRLLDGVIAAKAILGAGDTIMACALHTAFGISTLGVPITGDDGLPTLSFPEGATDALEVQLEEVTAQAAGMFEQCNSIQYDLAAVRSPRDHGHGTRHRGEPERAARVSLSRSAGSGRRGPRDDLGPRAAPQPLPTPVRRHRRYADGLGTRPMDRVVAWLLKKEDSP